MFDPTQTAVPPFDTGLLAVIETVGYHPFIIVRVHDGRIMVCLTQNEAGSFVESLASVPYFSQSLLIRAIERALQLEVYEAAELLLEWVYQSAGPVTERAFVGMAPGGECKAFYEYPAFELINEPSTGAASVRLELLEAVLAAYERTNGNEALRVSILECLAFGLSRAKGHAGEFANARSIVERGLAVCPTSIHLRASAHALDLKLQGKPVPLRLEKFLGRDSGYLKQFVCPEPFDRLDIGPTGEALVCNGLWCPATIGHILKEPVASILNSNRAQKIRESVTDGTYKYCNHLECGPLIQEALPSRSSVPSLRARQAMTSKDFRVQSVDRLVFAFDQSCNLSCPSCRTHLIMENPGLVANKLAAVEQKLEPLLPHLHELYINAAGELFASKVSRRLLELIDDDRCPHIRINIISNGTLFNEEEWIRFPGIHNKVQGVRISTDAARPETFEKLRRLAKHDTFIENLRFISGLRRSGVINEFKMSFTYQIDNFREMIEFVEFGSDLGADLLIFERLLNLGAFTAEEYSARAVHHPAHPSHAEFIAIIRNEAFRKPNIWHDFDYAGVENLSRSEVAARATRRGPAGHISG